MSGSLQKDQLLDLKNQRNQIFDILKGIAIITVVLGHCLQYGNGSDFIESRDFFDNWLYKLIYSFHMPLFMIISGYFFYFSNNTKRSPVKVFRNRGIRLIMPLFIWNGIYYLLHYMYNAGTASPFDQLVQYIGSSFMTLWFLWAVFWCSLVFIIVKYLFKDSILVYLLIFLLTFFMPDGYNLALYSFMYPFFLIGYFANRYNSFIVSHISRVKDIYVLGVLLTIFAVLMVHYSRESYIYTSGYSISGSDALHQLKVNFYRVLIGIVGSAFVIKTISVTYSRIKNRVNFSYISNLGKDSLGIYIISNYLNLILERVSSEWRLNYITTIIETIIILSISYFLTWLIKRIPITNRLLLGGK